MGAVFVATLLCSPVPCPQPYRGGEEEEEEEEGLRSEGFIPPFPLLPARPPLPDSSPAK